jgi:signal transduction histidine kinase
MQHIQLTLTELNQVLEEKKDLTALLSHDLRTPLRNVQTFAGILQQQVLRPEEVHEMAAHIEASADEQQKLLDNILEMLRTDYIFQQPQDLQPTNIQELVQETMHVMASAAHYKEVTLTADLHHGGLVDVQPELFKQVLTNLVGNAIKFSNPGSKVKIHIYRRHAQTLIDITDQGIGFDPANGEKLFDRFTKSGRIGTAGEPTTGLGLYLSRKIIRHQRGDLQAYSAGNGLGATFTIALN